MEVNNTILQKLMYPESQKHSSQVYGVGVGGGFVLHPISDEFENI